MTAADSGIVVVFTSRRSLSDDAEYAQMAQEMVERVSVHPGFLRHVSYRDQVTREGVTVAWFTGDDAVRSWKQDAAHDVAQRRGVESFYDEYRVTVAEVIREYGWTRSP